MAKMRGVTIEFDFIPPGIYNKYHAKYYVRGEMGIATQLGLIFVYD